MMLNRRLIFEIMAAVERRSPFFVYERMVKNGDCKRDQKKNENSISN